MISAATLMAISPMVASSNIVTTYAAGKQEQGNDLYVATKSYVYNKNGQRTTFEGKNYISRGKRVNFLGKVTDYSGNKKYYFKDSLGNEKLAPYKIIKGKAYFQVGKNAYIRVVNVSNIGNYNLYATNVSVTVSSKYASRNGQPAYDSNGRFIKNTYFKSNSKLTLDAEKYITVGNSVVTFYRVKGTDKFVSEQNISSVRQRLTYLEDTTNVLTNRATKLYTANGKVKTKEAHTTTMVDLHKNYPLNVDESVYLWVPSENKAELFYRVNSAWRQTGDDYTQSDLAGYVKASDVDYDYGAKFPDSVNTANDAEMGKEVATSGNKQKLQSLIDEKLMDNNLYKFSSLEQRWNYGGALQNAKAVASSKTATINEVSAATRELQAAKSALTGQKVKVVNLGWIDNSTANDIVKIVGSSYGDVNKYRPRMVNHNTELQLIEYKLNAGGSTDGTIESTKTLQLSDFIEVTDPNPKEKAGFVSSLSANDLAKDSTLKKYQKLITYNELTTALVAKSDAAVYTNSYRNNYQNVSYGNIKLTKSNQIIKKGNNLGYYAGPVVKVNGQYYVMFRSKARYFYVRADQISQDNFTKDSGYSKYNKALQNALNTTSKSSVRINTKAGIYGYERNSYGEFKREQYYRNASNYMGIAFPHLVKYNGDWYYTAGYPSTLGSAWRAQDVTFGSQK